MQELDHQNINRNEKLNTLAYLFTLCSLLPLSLCLHVYSLSARTHGFQRFGPPELSAPQVNPGRFHRFGHVAGLQVSKGPREKPVVSGQALASEIHSTR